MTRNMPGLCGEDEMKLRKTGYSLILGIVCVCAVGDWVYAQESVTSQPTRENEERIPLGAKSARTIHLVGIGSDLIKSGEYNKALVVLTEARQLESDAAITYFLGRTYALLGNRPQALLYYRQVMYPSVEQNWIAGESVEPMPLLEFFDLLVAERKRDEALQSYNKAIVNFWRLFNKKTQINDDHKKYLVELDNFNPRRIEIGQLLIRTWYEKQKHYVEYQGVSKQEQKLKRLISLLPDSLEIKVDLADHYAQHGKLQEAYLLYTEVAPKLPADRRAAIGRKSYVVKKKIESGIGSLNTKTSG